MTRRTCDELGVCQGQGCAGCAPAPQRVDTSRLPPGEFYFAPGTLVQGAPRKRRWGNAAEIIALACLFALASLALAAAIGLSAGWLSAGGWPL